MASWELGDTWTDAWTGVVAGVGIYLFVILLTRVFSQRALTTVSSFDFPVTVAIGAVVGRTALVHTSLLGGVIALATLFVAQAVVGELRNRIPKMRVVDSPPKLLVVEGRIIAKHLRRAHFNEADIYEKLRLTGVRSLSEVKLMVHERGGGISVITGDAPIDEALLDVVRDPEVRRSLAGEGAPEES